MTVTFKPSIFTDKYYPEFKLSSQVLVNLVSRMGRAIPDYSLSSIDGPTIPE